MLPRASASAIFLDSNAGAPLRTEVRAALLHFLSSPVGASGANPSSIHRPGRAARARVDSARAAVAASFGEGFDPEQVILTSSGTEANQLAIVSGLSELSGPSRSGHTQSDAESRPWWVTTPVEHDCVRQMRDWVSARGGVVSEIDVDAAGRPRLESLQALCDRAGRQPSLVSLIWVNNETGVISPIEEFSSWALSHGVPLHVDAAQAWGKLPLELGAPAFRGVRYWAFSAHKIGAVPGVGVLALGRGARFEPVIRGKQERGRRGGTENVLGLVALEAAARALVALGPAGIAAHEARLAESRNRFECALSERLTDLSVQGAHAPRVGGTCNVSFGGVGGEGLVMALDLAGLSVSAGSACASGVLEPSHVLQALGLSPARAMAAIRLSWAEPPTQEQAESALDILVRTVERLRAQRKPSEPVRLGGGVAGTLPFAPGARETLSPHALTQGRVPPA